MWYHRHMQKEPKSPIIKIKAKSARLDETSEILTTLITSLMNPKKINQSNNKRIQWWSHIPSVFIIFKPVLILIFSATSLKKSTLYTNGSNPQICHYSMYWPSKGEGRGCCVLLLVEYINKIPVIQSSYPPTCWVLHRNSKSTFLEFDLPNLDAFATIGKEQTKGLLEDFKKKEKKISLD